VLARDQGEGAAGKCFGFVQTDDAKPKRRLFELLKSQGMQNNQQVVFLSDGGEDVRELQRSLNPEAEHSLDWFHVAMRLTVLGHHAKGLPAEMPAAAVEDDDPGPPLRRDEIDTLLERIKHYLWHGNVVRALEEIEALELDLENVEVLPEPGNKLARAIDEFHTYLRLNAPFIPNYGERWRTQDTIASGFLDSALNQMLSTRMVKQQQMQWTKRGAHLLVQMRAQVLNEGLDHTFRGWYPGFRPNEGERQAVEAPGRKWRGFISFMMVSHTFQMAR
jgi:hypothetical protein